MGVRKGLGVLRNLDRSLKPVGTFEGFEQKSDYFVVLFFF